jgi:hypothetical protein
MPANDLPLWYPTDLLHCTDNVWQWTYDGFRFRWPWPFPKALSIYTREDHWEPLWQPVPRLRLAILLSCLFTMGAHCEREERALDRAPRGTDHSDRRN